MPTARMCVCADHSRVAAGLSMQRVFLHKEGMVRFGTEKYTPDTDLTNLYSHLTNACVHSTAPLMHVVACFVSHFLAPCLHVHGGWRWRHRSINKHSDTYQSDKDEIGGGSKWMYSKFVQYTKDHDGINLEAVWPHIITLINCTLRTGGGTGWLVCHGSRVALLRSDAPIHCASQPFMLRAAWF